MSEFKIVDSTGNELPSNLAKIGNPVIFIATIKNVSTTSASASLEFFDSASNVWSNNQPAIEGTQNIAAGASADFSLPYTVGIPVQLKEGDNYTIYAKASSGTSETVLGNNSSFLVMSVIGNSGAIPIPETSIYLLPVMLLGVLYFVWKDDKNEPQTD
ncbi:MAG: hypothetical protein Q7S21_03730 [archaeon]|nr:hypothetical protein [archaeon]